VIHNWQVAPSTHGRSYNHSPEELEMLRQEAEVAHRCGVPWQERGPPGPYEGGPEYWRGQSHRPGSNGGQSRWGNRGGKHRDYYTAMARIGFVGMPNKGTGKGDSVKGDKGKGTGDSGKGGSG
jgi:hypothetical protein